MKLLVILPLIFASVSSARADIIVGPFETQASFEPPEIMLNSTSGEMTVSINLDWNWANEFPWAVEYGGYVKLEFLDAFGSVAPQFILPKENRSVTGGTIWQDEGQYVIVYGQISDVPVHFEWSGLVEGSYSIALDRDYSVISATGGYNDSAIGIPIAEPLRITVVPEPCTLAIAGMGFLGLGWARRRLRGSN
ncbi:MAG TPA: PEP-CTERM sorting domain-containing protein [Planctomycetota bacterium]|nr:PEP-CTERM sorting domain-containing protein [Planctomycetota bacterium]